MQLINHDEGKPLQKRGPPGVLGQQGRMEHVRVGEHYPALISEFAPHCRGSVAVENPRQRAGQPSSRERSAERLELVLR